MHKFVHHQKISVTRLQQSRQVPSQLFMDRDIAISHRRQDKHELRAESQYDEKFKIVKEFSEIKNLFFRDKFYLDVRL